MGFTNETTEGNQTSSHPTGKPQLLKPCCVYSHVLANYSKSHFLFIQIHSEKVLSGALSGKFLYIKTERVVGS